MIADLPQLDPPGIERPAELHQIKRRRRSGNRDTPRRRSSAAPYAIGAIVILNGQPCRIIGYDRTGQAWCEWLSRP